MEGPKSSCAQELRKLTMANPLLWPTRPGFYLRMANITQLGCCNLIRRLNFLHQHLGSLDSEVGWNKDVGKALIEVDFTRVCQCVVSSFSLI